MVYRAAAAVVAAMLYVATVTGHGGLPHPGRRWGSSGVCRWGLWVGELGYDIHKPITSSQRRKEINCRVVFYECDTISSVATGWRLALAQLHCTVHSEASRIGNRSAVEACSMFPTCFYAPPVLFVLVVSKALVKY